MSIRSWRSRLNLPQDELGRRAGLQRSYISDVERGARNVSLKSIEKLAKALGISIATLFSDISSRVPAEALQPGELAEILLVEDSADDVLLITEALKIAGITNRFFVVRDGAAALDFLFCTGEFAYREASDQPQVVLLDLNLPKIDGLEVLRRIKADSRTKTIPVIVLTSSQHDLNIAVCKRLGAEAYIPKPVNFHNFSAATLKLSLQWALLKPAPLVGR